MQLSLRLKSRGSCALPFVRPLRRAFTSAAPLSRATRSAAKSARRASEPSEEIVDVWSSLKVDAPPRAVRRCLCPKCETAVSSYCPKCLLPLMAPPAETAAELDHAKQRSLSLAPAKTPVGVVRLPVAPFRLPISVDILHDRREKRTQSTAVHAAILAPEQVRIVPFRPNLHEKLQYDPSSTLLLFPDPNAPTVSEIDVSRFTRAVAIGQCNLLAPCPIFQAVVFLLFARQTTDSRWRNANSVLQSPLLSGLQRVRINKYHSRFWRYQTEHPRTALATVEAVYYLCREIHAAKHNGSYNGEFDNVSLVCFVYSVPCEFLLCSNALPAAVLFPRDFRARAEQLHRAA